MEIEPTAGEIDQVTAVFELPLTDALNCLLCPALSETDVGLTVTVAVTVVAGVREIVARPVLVESAELVAVTVTFCSDGTFAGAVYKPVCETEPTAGETDHVTAVLELPLTDALNCFVCAALRLAELGATVTLTGISVTVALPDLPVIPLVAVTVTFC